MLKYRIISGIGIVATLILACIFLPATALWILAAGLSAIAQFEFYSMMSMAGMPVFRMVGVLSGTLLITATFFSMGLGDNAATVAYRWDHAVLLLSVIAVFIRQFPQKHNDKPLETIACTLLGILYIPYLFNFFIRLAFTWDYAGPLQRASSTGLLLAFYLVVVVKSTDMGAYFVGSALGRHKLVPRISPSKTWEGLVGGFAAAQLGSWVFFLVTGGKLGVITLRWFDAALLGFLLGFAGILGDLAESLVKRACGAKDSAKFIPGMGGLLDVFDSLLFGVPLLYLYISLFHG